MRNKYLQMGVRAHINTFTCADTLDDCTKSNRIGPLDFDLKRCSQICEWQSNRILPNYHFYGEYSNQCESKNETKCRHFCCVHFILSPKIAQQHLKSNTRHT